MRLSIRWKLILAIGVPLLLVYLGTLWVMARQLEARTRQELEDQGRDSARDYAELIDARLGSLEMLALATRASLEARRDWSDQAIHDSLATKLGAAPLAAAMRAVLRTADDDAWRSIGVVRDDDGIRSEPPDARRLVEPGATPPWFTTALAERRNAWSEPYRDAPSDRRVATFATPVVRDGTVAGVVAVDLDLRRLGDYIEDIFSDGGVEIAVVSEESRFVTHRDESLLHEGIIAAARAAGRSDVIAVAERITAGENGVVQIDGLLQPARQWVFFAPIGETRWSLLGVMPEVDVLLSSHERQRLGVAILLVGLVLILILLGYMASRITRPLGRLAGAVRLLGRGDLETRVTGIDTQDEIGELATAFNRMVGELKEHVEALTRESAALEAAETEMRVGRRIQTSLLPKKFPDAESFAAYAVNVPALQVAGDFFDFFARDEQTLVVLIADVSGKGVPAALFMAMARTVLRQVVPIHASVSAAVAAANDTLEETGVGSMYVTLFMGWYDIPTGVMRYVNAGHPPPYRIDAGGTVTAFGEVGGPPVGMLPARKYEQAEARLAPGDRLVMFTDGVPEAEAPGGEFFGDARFEALLAESAGLDRKSLCDRVSARLQDYQAGKRSDDLTLVVFERKL